MGPSDPPSPSTGPDHTLVGLAALIAGLSAVGQLAAHLADRRDASTSWLATQLVVASAPVTVAVLWARRPAHTWLQPASLLVAGAALVVAATSLDEDPAAAALAVPACVVIVACRPRGITPALARQRFVYAGLLGMLVLAGLTVTPGPQGSGSLDLPSGTVGDGLLAIGRADARFLADTLGSADRTAGARCYFVLDSPGGAYGEVVACGPVTHRHAGDDEGEEGDEVEAVEAVEELGVWDIYPVGVEHGRLTLGEPTTGQAVEPDLLQRPDGLRPPRIGAVTDQPLTVSPGFAIHLDDEPPSSATETDGFLRVGTGTVTTAAVASPTVVLDEDGIERHAPDGYRFAAANLVFEDVEGITLEVLSGQQRVDVTALVARGGSYDNGWFAAVARDDGVEPVLEVTYRGRSQRLSMTTGERLGGDPLLYEPPTLTIDRDVERFEAAVQVPAPVPYPAQVLVSSYTIVGAQLNVFEPNQGWAPPGRAWLIVTIDGLTSPAFLDDDISLDPDVLLHFDPARSLALVGEDGAQLELIGAGPGGDTDLAVVFAVDETTRQATFRVAPTWVLVTGEQHIDVVSPTVDVPLTFS